MKPSVAKAEESAASIGRYSPPVVATAWNPRGMGATYMVNTSTTANQYDFATALANTANVTTGGRP